MKASLILSGEFDSFYENLNSKIMQFCRLCKFKKSRGKKCDSDDLKFEFFSRKLSKKQIKLEEMSEYE